MIRRFLTACVRARQRAGLGLLPLLVVGFVSLGPALAAEIASAAPAPPGDQMLEGVNAARAAAGLGPLVPTEALQALAAERSADMAARGYFAHTTPEGVDVFALMEQRGIGFSAAAENLAWNAYPEERAAAVALEAFLASPPHRANLLNPEFTQIGVGVARDGDETYFTLLFVG